jgi:hypothetical protein
MERVTRLAALLLLAVFAVATANAQGSDTQETQETPEQAKAEAQKPDAKASTGDLAKAAQNPVASLISVPVANVTDFNIGSSARDRNTILQFQPVIPIQLNENWNLITRTIGAITYQPDTGDPHLGTFGFGDINPTFFLSPARPGRVIWGAGPTFLLPTATDDVLGTGKLSMGPAVLVLVQPRKWTVGTLVSNLFSVAGPSDRSDVNTMSWQYFVNYNLKKGWYVTLQPTMSANWNAPSGNVWLVPFGGGVGRIMRLGSQPVNASIQAYVNVKRPDAFPSPTWQLKVQLAFLYPRKPK